MLGHRHQLDMAEAHLADIGHQPFGQFVPGRDASIGMEPRCGVHLIDRDRRIGGMAARALPHPRLVVPDMRRGIGDDGCGGGRRLGRTRQRIGLQRQTRAIRTDDGILVARARSETRDEQLPHAGRKAQPHRIPPRIPGVEITDHGDGARIRRPDGEAHTGDAIDRRHVGAKMRRQFEMPAFVEQMQIEFAQQRPEGIWILGFLHRARPGDAQPIRLAAADATLEQTVRRGWREPPQQLVAGARQHLDAQRSGQEGADDPSRRGVVRTQDGERIAQRAIGERLRHTRRQAGHFSHIVHAVTCATSCARPCSGTSIQAGRLAAS